MAHVNNRQNQCTFAVESNKIDYGIRARVMHTLSEYVCCQIECSEAVFAPAHLFLAISFETETTRIGEYMARPDTKLLLCCTQPCSIKCIFHGPQRHHPSRCTLDVRLRLRVGNTGSAEYAGKSQCDSVIASTNDGAH